MKQDKINLKITGMGCQSCASLIEKTLKANPNITDASVNFASDDANVMFNPEGLDTDSIISIIKKTGYGASQKENTIIEITGEKPKPIRLFLIWIIAMPFIIHMIVMMINHNHIFLPVYLQFILATIVQFVLAFPLYKSAWTSIKGGLANMDVLVMLGTSAIWLYSSTVLFFGDNPEHNVYFEASVMVIAFISLGKFLEERAKHNQLNSLNLMLNLIPKTAEVYENNEWVEKKYEDIKIGDLVRATIGGRICADGIVEEGNAAIDESHLTGEPLSVDKAKEDTVLSGSIIQEGNVVYKVKTLGSNTLLGDMIKALSEAQGTKAPIARIADKVAGIFVPIVIGIAILTFIINFFVGNDFTNALSNAVAVLVIACPCALGLATPAAIMVGMGLASKHAIWFKDASSLEATAKVNTIVLDKTGTLTKGEPKVTDVWLNPESTFSTESLWQIIGSIEEYSTHPLAIALQKEAKQHNITKLTATNIKNTLGLGIEGDIENLGHIKAGNLAFCDFQLPKNIGEIWDISTIIAVTCNNKALGAFALSDELKADSYSTIQKIKELNIDPYIMSGDKQSVVNFVAKQLNIAPEKAKGEMSPRNKAGEIERMTQLGKQVAMVGDGVNDAPALAKASVGFAMGNGSDIAEQTANVTLLHHSGTDITNALVISRATLKNIKQNLFFAFIYNIIGIPLAAMGVLTPVIAGAAMALSSISVITNALRLKRLKIK